MLQAQRCHKCACVTTKYTSLTFFSVVLHFNRESKKKGTTRKKNTHQMRQYHDAYRGFQFDARMPQSGIQFNLNYVHRCVTKTSKEFERQQQTTKNKQNKINPTMEGNINTMLHQFGRKRPCKCKLSGMLNNFIMFYELDSCAQQHFFLAGYFFFLRSFETRKFCVVANLHWICNIGQNEWNALRNTCMEWRKKCYKPKIVLGWRWSIASAKIPRRSSIPEEIFFLQTRFLRRQK